MTFAYGTPDIVIAHGLSVPVIEKNEEGRSQVDIVCANEHGISHNLYEEFHVSERGVVLNNHAARASTILNEVVGTNISQLNGPIEVAGKTADVIVANPNGIACNGCGFINSMRSILTTGKFILEQGEITGIEVNGGHITIGERGAIIYTAPVINHGSLSLIASGVTINGKIKGEIYSDKKAVQENPSPEQTPTDMQSIRVLAGRRGINKKFIDNHNTQLIEITNNLNEYREDEKIDVGMLGGMYARQIYLHGSKAGIGVNSHAIIHGVDHITLDTNGELALNAPLTANSVDIQNASVFNNNNRLTVKENISLRGVEKFFNGCESDFLSQDNIPAAVIKARDINIAAQSIYNYGFLLADNNSFIKTGHDHNTMSDEQGSNLLTAISSINFHENLLKNHGSILSNGDIAIHAPSLHNGIYDEEKSKSIPVIHANNELKINTFHGINSGGVLSADKKLSIRSIDDTVSSGTFNNKGFVNYQNEYAKFNDIDTLINRKAIKNIGGLIFATNEIDVKLNSFNNHGAMHDITSESDDYKSGEIYSGNKININVNDFINSGGKITSKDINILAKNFSNISGVFYGINNKITSENLIHKTKITAFSEKENYIYFASPKGLIESENSTAITVTDKLFIEGADIISGFDLNINGGKEIKITSSLIEEKKTNKTIKNTIEDSFFKIYSINNKQKVQYLTQQPIIPMLNSKNNIFLSSDGNIELAGTKIYADGDVSIKNSHDDIEFKPFYLINASHEESCLSRDVKILWGIKTWEENKFSVNSNFAINDLTTEVFFGKKLSINSHEGTVYVGKVDFAFMDNGPQTVRSTIDITGKEIKSTREQKMERSEIKTHDTSFGFRIEGHSSVIDAISNISKNIDVQGTEKAYVKASIMKSAQVLGEATNVAFGDTLGGSAGFYKETADTQNNQNNFNGATNIFYADDIFFTATTGSIDLEGADLLSISDDSHIKLRAKDSIHFHPANDSSYWKFNRESQEFTLGTVANSNLVLGSAGAGVRAGYNNINQQEIESRSRFIPFNLSAKNIYFDSGQDVSLYGGKITAGLVDYNIAGTLKIETAQDTSTSETREGSYGGSLGLDINTYTLFGLNGDIHGSSGNSQDRSALSTQQSGVFARNIRGTIGGDFWLTGAYLIGQTPEDELNVHGKIYAKSLEDTEKKEGFVAGGGINIGADGRPGINIDYSSPALINYKASQLPTLTGVTLKTNNEIIGSFNTNKNELMKIIQNDIVGDIEIRGTFAFINKKNKEMVKSTKPEKMTQRQQPIHYKLTPHQIYAYATSVPEGETIADTHTPFKKNGKSYIKIDDHHFEVSWDKINQTWRIISPLHGALKFKIPVEWYGDGWKVHSKIGLPGGGDEGTLPGTSENKLISRLSSLFIKNRFHKENILEMDDISDYTVSGLEDPGYIKSKHLIDYNTARLNGYITDGTLFREVNKEQFKLLSIGADINHNVREQLKLGAGNQKSDVIKSGGNSLLRTSVLQGIKANFFHKQSEYSQEYIRIMQAACTGNCSEHSEMAYHYANSIYGDKLTIRKMSNDDNSHSFIIIEEKNNTDKKNRVIVDTWTLDDGFSLIEDNTLVPGRMLKSNEQSGREIYRFDKNTQSYKNLSDFFEKYMAEHFDPSQENLNAIVDNVKKNKFSDEIWDQQSFLKEKNLVYKLRNAQNILIPADSVANTSGL